MATTNHLKHFYFNRLLHLWNSLPPIDISRSYNESIVKEHFPLSLTLIHPIPVPITSVAHAPNVWFLPNQLLKFTLHAPRLPLLNSLAGPLATHYHF